MAADFAVCDDDVTDTWQQGGIGGQPDDYEDNRPRWVTRDPAESGDGRDRVVITLVWPDRSADQADGVRSAVLTALRTCDEDFRTPASLAADLDLPVDLVTTTLSDLVGAAAVRRPFAHEARFGQWYRLVDRGMTRNEHLRRLRAFAGRDTF